MTARLLCLFLASTAFHRPTAPRFTDRPAGSSVAPTASRGGVPAVTAKTARPWPAIPPAAASSDELGGPFSETAVRFVLIRFYPGIEPTSSRRERTEGTEESGRRGTLVPSELGAAAGAPGSDNPGEGFDDGWARDDPNGGGKEPAVPTEPTEDSEAVWRFDAGGSACTVEACSPMPLQVCRS